MNNELLAMLEYIEQERGISKEQVVKALEQAILSAYRKSSRPASDLNVKVNLRTGELKAWARSWRSAQPSLRTDKRTVQESQGGIEQASSGGREEINETFAKEKNIPFALTGTEPQTALAGDLNKDGRVNLKDVVLLRRYIAGGWNVTLG